MSSIDCVNLCKEYMETKNISQAKLANKMGIGENTFPRVLNGTYHDFKSLENKLIVFFEKENLRENASFVRDIDFARTGISNKESRGRNLLSCFQEYR